MSPHRKAKRPKNYSSEGNSLKSGGLEFGPPFNMKRPLYKQLPEIGKGQGKVGHFNTAVPARPNTEGKHLGKVEFESEKGPKVRKPTSANFRPPSPTNFKIKSKFPLIVELEEAYTQYFGRTKHKTSTKQKYRIRNTNAINDPKGKSLPEIKQ